VQAVVTDYNKMLRKLGQSLDKEPFDRERFEESLKIFRQDAAECFAVRRKLEELADTYMSKFRDDSSWHFFIKCKVSSSLRMAAL